MDANSTFTNNPIMNSAQNFFDKSDLEITGMIVNGAKEIADNALAMLDVYNAMRRMTIGSILGVLEAAKDPEVQLQIELAVPVAKTMFNDVKKLMADAEELTTRMKAIIDCPAVKEAIDKLEKMDDTDEMKNLVEKMSALSSKFVKEDPTPQE